MPQYPRLTLSSLRRARLFPVVVFYASASFVVLQVCDILVNQLALPGWVFPSALILLLAGFPMVVATALVYGARSTATETDAEHAGEDAGGTREPARSLRLPRLLGRLTWRRTVAAGGAAFALLFLLVAGYAGSRSAGIGPFATLLAAGVLGDQEVLVLAEFDARGTDPDMGRTVTEAVRVDLGQSASIGLLEGERVRDALVRMARSPDEPLDATLARELAVREGVKAVVTGEVSGAGDGYILVARVISAEDGATLVAVRETAASDAALIGAIDRLSRSLRERIGEPLRSLATRPPLTQITTSSLEALKLYARAQPVYREDPGRSLPLLEQAVALDPAFVAAWFHLGVAREQVGAPTSAVRDALIRGAAHLDRLSGMERYLFHGIYLDLVEGDAEGSLQTYETMINLYPDDPTARVNLARALLSAGESARALELVEPLLQGPSPSFLALGNMTRALIRENRPDSALAVLDRAPPDLRDHPAILRFRLSAHGAARDYDGVERKARQMVGPGTPPVVRILGWGALAAVAAQQGRDKDLEDAMVEVRQAVQELELLAPGTEPGYILFWRASRLAVREGDREALLAYLEEMRPPEPADSIAAMDQPLPSLAQAHALAGDVDGARTYLELARRWWPEGMVRAEEAEFRTAEALIALEEGRLDDAEAALVQDRFVSCPRCLVPLVARAREAEGDLERALELWDLYDLRSRFVSSVYYDALWVPELYEARARLREQLGDRAGAARELRLALAAFSRADPVYESRVAAWLRDLRRME